MFGDRYVMEFRGPDREQSRAQATSVLGQNGYDVFGWRDPYRTLGSDRYGYSAGRQIDARTLGILRVFGVDVKPER